MSEDSTSTMLKRKCNIFTLNRHKLQKNEPSLADHQNDQNSIMRQNSIMSQNDQNSIMRKHTSILTDFYQQTKRMPNFLDYGHTFNDWNALVWMYSVKCSYIKNWSYELSYRTWSNEIGIPYEPNRASFALYAFIQQSCAGWKWKLSDFEILTIKWLNYAMQLKQILSNSNPNPTISLELYNWIITVRKQYQSNDLLLFQLHVLNNIPGWTWE